MLFIQKKQINISLCLNFFSPTCTCLKAKFRIFLFILTNCFIIFTEFSFICSGLWASGSGLNIQCQIKICLLSQLSVASYSIWLLLIYFLIKENYKEMENHYVRLLSNKLHEYLFNNFWIMETLHLCIFLLHCGIYDTHVYF